ncbi:MAG: SUF system Fe-S cluster assembly regulator [Gammaproteobacteria bacterium]|nr:SUF system Fe-S cluster assembly regulator [Gammaproteobacteria bacterium]MDE2345415.1 SUF system Fe-S cluster assembly regulator [Gammaproteobacteria bacterium]
MLRISKLTDYGTVVLAQMAWRPDSVHTAAELATATRVALPTVSKLLKFFSHAGLVTSQRGARGGYRLARAPELITAVQIIDAVEGPVAITQCSLGHDVCGIQPVCGVGHNWQRISLTIRESLKTVTLAHLARPAVAVAAPLEMRVPLTQLKHRDQK